MWASLLIFGFSYVIFFFCWSIEKIATTFTRLLGDQNQTIWVHRKEKETFCSLKSCHDSVGRVWAMCKQHIKKREKKQNSNMDVHTRIACGFYCNLLYVCPLRQECHKIVILFLYEFHLRSKCCALSSSISGVFHSLSTSVSACVRVRWCARARVNSADENQKKKFDKNDDWMR